MAITGVIVTLGLMGVRTQTMFVMAVAPDGSLFGR